MVNPVSKTDESRQGTSFGKTPHDRMKRLSGIDGSDGDSSDGDGSDGDGSDGDGSGSGKTDECIRRQLDAIPTVNGKGLFIDTTTYAEYFGETEANVRKRCASGSIRAVKVGKKWRIPVAYLYEQLETEEA